MKTKVIDILKNVGWVLIGVSLAFAIIIPIVILAAISSFSFGELPTSTKIFVFILIFIATSTGPFIGGYVTAKNVVTNTTLWVSVTCFLITGIIILNIDFNPKHYSIEEIISIPLTIIFTFYGGYYGLKKKTFINSFPSHPDIPSQL